VFHRHSSRFDQKIETLNIPPSMTMILYTMNKIKESLELVQINTNYLNFDAVYDYCGDDLMKYIE